MLRTFEGRTFEYRNKSMVALGICTGFRINELLSLKVNDILYQGTVKDQLYVPKRLMKGDHSRYPKKIYPEAKKYLGIWYEQIRKKYKATKRSYYFISRKGGRITNHHAWEIMKSAAKDAGIDPSGVGTHSLRKTFASRVYDYWLERSNEGARVEPMRMVQMELGHADIKDTYSYLSFKMEEKPDDLFHDYDLLLASD